MSTVRFIGTISALFLAVFTVGIIVQALLSTGDNTAPVAVAPPNVLPNVRQQAPDSGSTSFDSELSNTNAGETAGILQDEANEAINEQTLGDSTAGTVAGVLSSTGQTFDYIYDQQP